MNIPPYVSRTPPPLNGIDDEENDDEEFGTFVVSSDLGEEVYDVFEKATHSLRNEDNISEDSGFCMNSVGQTQSPCDISPLSSSYTNKGNESVNDTHGTSDIHCSTTEVGSNVIHDSSKITGVSLNSNLSPKRNIDPGEEIFGDDLSEDRSSPCGRSYFDSCFPDKDECSVNSVSKHDLDEESLDVQNEQNVTQPSPVVAEVHSIFNQTDETEIETDEFSSYSSNNLCTNGTAFDDNYPNLTKSNSSSPFKFDESETNHTSEISNDFHCDDYEKRLSYLNINKNKNVETAKNSVDEWGSDEEFSDFTAFQSTSSFAETTTVVNEEPTDFDYQYSEQLFGEDVLDDNISYDECTLQSAIQSNVVWNCLQCFEETPAFKYQWSSSFTNMKFLQALQIDSRNILHGPWSRANKLNWIDVPSHSENISFNSDFIQSSSRAVPSVIPSESIPDAHFDWISSGLVNPLQSMNSPQIISELPSKNELCIVNSKTSILLESLPSLAFVKAHHIIFKRD